MVSLHGEQRAPWCREKLATDGITVEQINGLFRVELYSSNDAYERFDRDTKDRYTVDDVYGRTCFVSEFIHVPVDYVFAYLANIYSLEEWTFGIRNLKHIGDDVYQARDLITENTEIFLTSDVNSKARTIDYAYAWDQKEELWMRRYLRVVDAAHAINRPGTIVSWFSWKHPYYEKSRHLPSWLNDAQQKEGRVWLGDFWRNFHAWHKIEADNLRYILEHRYHNKK